MQFVAADWFKSDKREDHVASRSGCVLQKLEAQQVHMKMNLTQMVLLKINIQAFVTLSLGTSKHMELH